MYKTVKFIVAALLSSNILFAQPGIKVHIIDSISGKPMGFTSIIVAKEHGNYSGYGESYGGTTDTNGNAEIEPMDTGTYTIVAMYPGYYNNLIKGVLIKQGNITYRTIKMKWGDSEMTRDSFIINKPKSKVTDSEEY